MNQSATGQSASDRGAELGATYLEALLAGRRETAFRLVREAIENGLGIAQVYMHVLQAAQYESGRRWQDGQINVAQEHYCTAATQLLMAQLYPHVLALNEANHCHRSVVIAAVSGELHELGARMLADFFEMAGWTAVYLGASTPRPDLLMILRDVRPDLVALSASLREHVGEVRDIILALRADPALMALPTLVGGHPFIAEPDLAWKIGADGTAPDAPAALSVATRLVQSGRARPKQVRMPGDPPQPAEVASGSSAPLFEQWSALGNALADLSRQAERTSFGLRRDMARQEKELQALDERLRALYEMCPLGIMLSDLEGRCLEVNPAFARLCGEPVDTLKGRDGWSFLLAEPATEKAGFVESLVRNGRYGPREMEYRGTDGQRVPVRLNGALVSAGEGAGYLWSIVEDITAQKQAEELLERRVFERTREAETARQTAELANGLKDKLLAMLAHDLRTPLGVVGGYAEFLEGKLAGRVSQDELTFIRHIRESARYMAGLIDGVVAPATIRTPSIALQLRPTDLVPLVRRVAATNAILARAKGIRLLAVPRRESMVTRIDPLRIEQVLTNLISNAVKYTHAGGQVTIEIEALPDRICVSVRDTGIGIRPETKSGLFRAFNPGAEGGTDGEPSTGLGLFICASVVEAHGGSIAIDSTPGCGTRVTVELPVR